MLATSSVVRLDMQGLAKEPESIVKLCHIAEEEPSIGLGLVIEICLWLPDNLKSQQSFLLSLLTKCTKGQDLGLHSHLLAAELSEGQALQLLRFISSPGNLDVCKKLVEQVLTALTLVAPPSSEADDLIDLGDDRSKGIVWPRRRETMVQLAKAMAYCLGESSLKESLCSALEPQLAAALRLLMAEPELQACGAEFASEIMHLDAAECKILQVRVLHWTDLGHTCLHVDTYTPM